MEESSVESPWPAGYIDKYLKDSQSESETRKSCDIDRHITENPEDKPLENQDGAEDDVVDGLVRIDDHNSEAPRDGEDVEEKVGNKSIDDGGIEADERSQNASDVEEEDDDGSSEHNGDMEKEDDDRSSWSDESSQNGSILDDEEEDNEIPEWVCVYCWHDHYLISSAI